MSWSDIFSPYNLFTNYRTPCRVPSLLMIGQSRRDSTWFCPFELSISDWNYCMRWPSLNQIHLCSVTTFPVKPIFKGNVTIESNSRPDTSQSLICILNNSLFKLFMNKMPQLWNLKSDGNTFLIHLQMLTCFLSANKCLKVSKTCTALSFDSLTLRLVHKF